MSQCNSLVDVLDLLKHFQALREPTIRLLYAITCRICNVRYFNAALVPIINLIEDHLKKTYSLVSSCSIKVVKSLITQSHAPNLT